jgi:hypothetical protein
MGMPEMSAIYSIEKQKAGHFTQMNSALFFFLLPFKTASMDERNCKKCANDFTKMKELKLNKFY